MNNFKRRALIFVTFFGSCLAISLLSAALGTKHWITAHCKRTENAEKSNGTVNFGLFVYEANLNFGLGDRPYEANMLGQYTLYFLHCKSILFWICLDMFSHLSIDNHLSNVLVKRFTNSQYTSSQC